MRLYIYIHSYFECWVKQNITYIKGSDCLSPISSSRHSVQGSRAKSVLTCLHASAQTSKEKGGLKSRSNQILFLAKATVKTYTSSIMGKGMEQLKADTDVLHEESNSLLHKVSGGGGEQCNTAHEKLPPAPPDGGWGWAVVFASFMCNLILDGIAYIFGVLLSPMAEHFEADKGQISWVGSLLCGMYMLSGPIVGGLVNKFGCRPVCIAGAVVSWAAFSLSTFSPNVSILMITYGILGGFGLGLIRSSP